MPAYKPGDPRIKEGWVKDKVKKELKKFPNIMVDMPASNMHGKSGRHDFLICQKGLYWTIETKAGRNKPTANQIRFAEETKFAGGISLLVNEFNLKDVTSVARYVDTNEALPYEKATDFKSYS